jgi:capsular polysaccharide biosynthesis protein
MMLTDYVRIVVRRWWLVVLPLVPIALITWLTTPSAAPTTYVVTMTFAVGLPPEPLRDQAYNYDRHYNWLASEYVTQGFALIVGKGTFAENVARRLARQDVALRAPLAGAIRSEYRSSVLVIYVSWPDAEQAAQIAQAVVDELNENYEAYWPQLKGAGASPVRLMDPIVPVATPAPLRNQLDLPLRIALGLAAGIGLALLWHHYDPFIRERREIERLGFSIIAEIPQR